MDIKMTIIDLKKIDRSLTNLIEGYPDAELMKARAMRARFWVEKLNKDFSATDARRGPGQPIVDGEKP